MRKITSIVILFFTLAPNLALAILSMELTRGMTGAIPITIVPFSNQQGAAHDEVSKIIIADLKNSGRFKIVGEKELKQFPNDAQDVSQSYFRKLGTDNIVVGKVELLSGNQYEVSFQLVDILKGAEKANVIVHKKYKVTDSGMRAVAHGISDLVYQQLTGVRGIFSTKLAYIVIQHLNKETTRYLLEVSDQDGFNPKPLLTSSEPIMSPAWSPDGKQIAYVSFENKRASIYIQNVVTGERTLISHFPGINGAPAWSPDGKKLALVLSKGGSPNIYVMEIATKKLTPITNDFYINTEPTWSTDGKSLMYTSNRSGAPQIYQVNLLTKISSRISYDGDYNARASFAQDGKNLAMIHKIDGIYKIAILNLDVGTTKVLTPNASDSASPSIAPNGSMILYDTFYRGRNVLAVVSTDGRVQVMLPARSGEAQDPAWSPFLS